MDKVFKTEERLEVFKNELRLIKNNRILNYAIEAIKTLPNYFFSIPASSTGKYHPNYALGEGGLVRHTQAAVRFLVECFRLEWYSGFSSEEQDLMIVALMLHDGWKSGVEHSKYTLDEHPMIAAKQLRENTNLNKMLEPEQLELIYDCIESHMGYWNRNRRTGVQFAPAPKSPHQKLVHFCDYVASRKLFELNEDFVPTR